MIVLEPLKLNQPPKTLKSLFLYSVQLRLNKLMEANDPSISQIKNIYNITEIEEALNTLYINESAQLCYPEQSRYFKIIRYLEFGGEGVKPTHLISKTRDHILGITQ